MSNGERDSLIRRPRRDQTRVIIWRNPSRTNDPPDQDRALPDESSEGRVDQRLMNFYPDDPETWLIQVEAFFEDKRITADRSF